jgi:ABC-type multidrug transport system fused ATPase/permease subunit
MLYLSQIGDLQRRCDVFLKSIMINSVSCQRLAEIMDTALTTKEMAEAIDCRFARGEVRFKDVSFTYQKNKFIFKKMSFVFSAHARIALVGPSGCGKTTLLSLILRLYDLQGGVIFIDGYDIKRVKLALLRERCGVALQEPLLWNDSIKNNILYGRSNATPEEVVWAAKVAEADGFIGQLPEGYETVIGENACKISEGQKQRIAIARAVIKKPKILMLDEAMASLDSHTEDKIIDNIKREFQDSTLIVVSHRLSTVTQMDAVYFLQGPEKIDIGTHERLFLSSPRYKTLFASQIETKSYEDSRAL